jgi:type IV secretory pathway VirB3-like protein
LHGDNVPVKLLVLGVVVAVIVFLATSGHVLFLPLVLVLPLGLLFRGGRQRHQRSWSRFGRK